MIAVGWSDCSSLIWYHIAIVLSNDYILFIDFNLVAHNFLKSDWCKMLSGYVDFLFDIFLLRITVVSVERLENWAWFK